MLVWCRSSKNRTVRIHFSEARDFIQSKLNYQNQIKFISCVSYLSKSKPLPNHLPHHFLNHIHLKYCNPFLIVLNVFTSVSLKVISTSLVNFLAHSDLPFYGKLFSWLVKAACLKNFKI